MSIALKKAQQEEPYTIPFDGQYAFTFTEDVGLACALTLKSEPNKFALYNLPGQSLAIADCAKIINQSCDQALISATPLTYPFAKGVCGQKFFAAFPKFQLKDFSKVVKDLCS